jgi:hypothetical protein
MGHAPTESNVLSDGYDYPLAVCDVAPDRRRALQSYRDKRHLWLSWIDTDEHHAIWTTLSSMVWTDAAFKVMAQFATDDEDNPLNNSLLGQVLVDGQIATQVLAIRRLMDNGSSDIISLRRLVKDLASGVGCSAFLSFQVDLLEDQSAGVRGLGRPQARHHDVLSLPDLVRLRVAEDSVASGGIAAERQIVVRHRVCGDAQQPVRQHFPGPHAAEISECLARLKMLPVSHERLKFLQGDGQGLEPFDGISHRHALPASERPINSSSTPSR